MGTAVDSRTHNRVGAGLWISVLASLSATAWGAPADLLQAVAQVEPSVVVVIASHEVGAAEPGKPTALRHMIGSGFFVSPTDIVTSARVLEGAQSVEITTASGERCGAAIAGVDLPSRIAMLRVAEPVGTPVRFATGDVAKGQAIFTLGSYLGMGLTVTAGMVNGTERTLTASGLPSVNDAFQIDAPVSADGAGSPVFAMDGSVVGMVLYSLVPEQGMLFRPPDQGGGPVGEALMPSGRAEDAEGRATEPQRAIAAVVTFCIPSDTLEFVSRQFSADGRVKRGRLGVQTRPVPAAVAAHLGVDPASSALVVSVAEGGPGALAGLKPYDVIVAMDGQPLRGVRRLVKSVQMRPGQDVSLTVRRGADELRVTAHIDELVSEAPELGPGGVTTQVSAAGDRPRAWLGVRAEPIDPSLAAHLGPAADGACVAYVFPGSPAEKAGLRRGDILVSIGPRLGTDRAAAADAVARLWDRVASAAPGESVVLTVSRMDHGEQTVQLHASLAEMPAGLAIPPRLTSVPPTGLVF